MATTPNFGWTTPNDTDYVKDGASAIRTLGNAIDASMADLEGGTTGQVLSKNSNTDMDFIWVTPNDADAIQNTIVDAKGDLITATAADTPARLAVGTNGYVLKANSATSTGLEWAAPGSGGWTQIGSTVTLTGGNTFSIGSIPSTYRQLMVTINNYSFATTSTYLLIAFNSSSPSNNYGFGEARSDGNNAYSWGGSAPWMYVAPRQAVEVANSTQNNHVSIISEYANTSTTTLVHSYGTMYGTTSGNYYIGYTGNGLWDSTTAVTSIYITSNSGANFDAGSFSLYGMA